MDGILRGGRGTPRSDGSGGIDGSPPWMRSATSYMGWDVLRGKQKEFIVTELAKPLELLQNKQQM